jgi:hypothetical protein
VIFVVLWNAAIIVTLAYTQTHHYVLLSDIAQALDNVSAGATFLTAAVLAFLFGSSK